MTLCKGNGFVKGQRTLIIERIGNMVFDFIVLIKEEEIKKINITEKLVEWGGEKFSQDPPQYVYDNSSLLFHEFLDLDYYKRNFSDIIGNDLNMDEFIPFILLGSHMLEVEKLVNCHNGDMLKKHDIFGFLEDLMKLDEFAILIEREEEYIDKRYYVKTKEELINVFCNCFVWDSPEGAFITK